MHRDVIIFPEVKNDWCQTFPIAVLYAKLCWNLVCCSWKKLCTCQLKLHMIVKHLYSGDMQNSPQKYHTNIQQKYNLHNKELECVLVRFVWQLRSSYCIVASYRGRMSSFHGSLHTLNATFITQHSNIEIIELMSSRPINLFRFAFCRCGYIVSCQVKLSVTFDQSYSFIFWC